eukprot:gene17267-biopygen8924
MARGMRARSAHAEFARECARGVAHESLRERTEREGTCPAAASECPLGCARGMRAGTRAHFRLCGRALGVRWRPPASAGVRWRPLASVGVRWRPRASVGVRPTDVNERQMRAGVQTGMRARMRAGVRARMRACFHHRFYDLTFYTAGEAHDWS